MSSMHTLLWQQCSWSWQPLPWWQCRQLVLCCFLYCVSSSRSSVPRGCSASSHWKSMMSCLVYTDLLTILVTEIRENLDILQCHFVINYRDPFNGLFSGTTRVSRYQKGKANLDFTEARDGEWQWHQLGHMQVCTSLQTDNHTSTPPLSFLQTGCPSCCLTNSIKALRGLW